MKKELLILDRSICLSSEFKAYKNYEFNKINWDLLFSCGLKSKSICMLYDKLIYSNCVKEAPSKYYKLMSAIYIGNHHHNQVLNNAKKSISNALAAGGIEIFDYKNIFMDRDFKNNLMPNDVDFVAEKDNAFRINSILKSKGYQIKYVNGKASNQKLPVTFDSVFYEKKSISRYDYPIKIDITYSFQHNYFLESILMDYKKENCLKKELVLLLISMIEFYEHINFNMENISISDLLKVKRIKIQLNHLNSYEKDLMIEIANRYQVISVYSIVNRIIDNYTSIF